MPYQKIEFMDRNNAQSLKGDKKTIVISIGSPNTKQAQICNEFKDVLFQEFDNIEHLSGHLVRFSKQNADDILAFVDKNKEDTSRIIVHCMMGESRSAAVALFLAEKLNIKLEGDTSKHNPWIVHVFQRVDRNYLKR